MRVRTTGNRRSLGLGMMLLLGVPIGASCAHADWYPYRHRLQCVPFARADSGIQIRGNANTWWYQADGVYARGRLPEMGAVLSFSATNVIPLGHVAVVSAVLNTRQIEIDHANWGGGINRGVSVVDVSPNNDWTAVRVQLRGSENYGAVYPTHGFIYNRPDNGTMIVAGAPAAPVAVPVTYATRATAGGQAQPGFALGWQPSLTPANALSGVHYTLNGVVAYGGDTAATASAQVRKIYSTANFASRRYPYPGTGVRFDY